MRKLENIKTTLIDYILAIVGILLVLGFILLSGCNFVDFQLDALTCNIEDIGTIECIDEEFYGCPLSLRWTYIGSCGGIDEVVIEKYNIDFSEYLRCCQ